MRLELQVAPVLRGEGEAVKHDPFIIFAADSQIQTVHLACCLVAFCSNQTLACSPIAASARLPGDLHQMSVSQQKDVVGAVSLRLLLLVG